MQADPAQVSPMGNNSTPLAAKYYTDARYFTLDKENIFFRSWQCVCHQSEILMRMLDREHPDYRQ
jgi:hypothetical protein